MAEGSHSVNIYLVRFGRSLSSPPPPPPPSSPPALILMACCFTACVYDIILRKLVGTAEFYDIMQKQECGEILKRYSGDISLQGNQIIWMDVIFVVPYILSFFGDSKRYSSPTYPDQTRPDQMDGNICCLLSFTRTFVSKVSRTDQMELSSILRSPQRSRSPWPASQLWWTWAK